MQLIVDISQIKTLPIKEAGLARFLGRGVGKAGNLAKRVIKTNASGVGGGEEIRKANAVVKGVKRMARAGGDTGKSALDIAKKTHGNLAKVNRDLLAKDVNKWNIKGRITRRTRLRKTQKLMSSLEKSKSVATTPVKKPVMTKKQMLIGSGVLGAGVLGGQAIGAKGKEVNSQYNRYYQ